MKQLGNQNAGFIYNETPTTPMHTAGLGIYDQSTTPNQHLGHKDIIKYIKERIHLAPIFQKRYVEVPLGLDKPYWIDDPDFNVEFHIRHIALPQPGDWRQLCIMVSRLNSKPLDFNHPLWEIYVIEGLDNIDGLPKGSFALLIKVHHAIIDGASGQEIFGALHDLLPDAIPSKPTNKKTNSKPTNQLELLGRAIPKLISKPLQQTTALYRNTPRLLRNMLKLYRGSLASGTQLRVPQTRFNYNISPHRVFEGTNFSLDDIKLIKNAVGNNTTVNDVIINIVAGGLRHYLEKHQELPTQSLAAILPQDIRNDSSEQHIENQIGALFTSLHTSIEDPIERLIAIHHSHNKAKYFALEMETAGLIQNYMGGFLNPQLGRRLNRLIQNTRLLERFGPLACNTIISNAAGPNFPLYHAGAKMVSYWGIPPISDCLGLSHAAFSYCGRVSLSAMACRQMMTDPAVYMQCLEQSFEELLQAAKNHQKQQEQIAPAAKSKKAKRKRATSSNQKSAGKQAKK